MKKIKVLFFVLFLALCLTCVNISSVKASTYQTTDKVSVKGAQIRTTGNAGIRFVGEVETTDTNNVSAYGICIAYGLANADEDFVLNGNVNGKSVLNAQVSKTNEGLFYITLYNIPSNQYGQLVSARAYIIENGEVSYAKEVVVRSLGQVAVQAYNNNEGGEYISNVISVIDTMYSNVTATFDSEDISFKGDASNISSAPLTTIPLDTYKNGMLSDGSTYIADSAFMKSSSNGSTYIYSNKALLKYDETYKAYKIVAKEAGSGSATKIKEFTVDWDYAMLYLSTNELSSLEINQYVVFDAELSVGMGAFNAKIYEESAFVSKSKEYKLPEVLPTVYNDNQVANNGWKSSLDNKVYTYYPGYSQTVSELIYTPVWYYEVDVTFDYAGNLGYENRDAMVSAFVTDFKAYSGRALLDDASNFFDITYSVDGTSMGYNFLANSVYSKKWAWLLEYINSVREDNSKAALSSSTGQAYARGELHNFLNASNEKSTYGCDYSSDAVANGYLKLDLFKTETKTYLYDEVLPSPTRDGYEFKGWKSSLDNQIYTTYTASETQLEGITFKAVWQEEGSANVEEGLDCVSDVVTSETVDTLLSTYNGYALSFTSSNPNLYNINGNQASTSRLYQTHKAQTVTITMTATLNSETITITKDITIDPVLFDEMTNPKAVYFAVSSATSYTNNSERYKTEGTMFSEKFRENMDMVYYAFAIPQSDGTLTINTKYIDTIMQLKKDGIRVLLVVDGANKAPLQAMVQLSDKDDTRKVFVDNIVSLIETYNFDGVDIDWEFPGTSGLDTTYYTTARDQMNLNKLLRDLRTTLNSKQDKNGSNFIISVAIPSSSWGAKRYDFTGEASKVTANDSTLAGIDTYCDYVNMMSYDLNNGEYATHVAACYSSSNSKDYGFGCVYGAEKFMELGLSKEKIILGSAAYGKTYSLTGTVNEEATYPGLGVAGTLSQLSGVTGSYASGTIYYSVIAQLMENPNYKVYTEYNNGNLVASYLYSSTDKIFITFDSEAAIKAKCEYAKANDMGIMVWAYGEDATDTIVDTICDNLK